MKTLTTKILVLFCLSLVTGLASADDRRDAGHGYQASGYPEWKLGNSRGGSRGHEILYRANSRSPWRVAPGAAVAVADGWVLGVDHHTNGYGIYRWNGRDWSRMPGNAVQIGGTYRQPWVVNAYGERYVWNGHDWRRDLYAGRDNDRGRRERDDRHRNDHDDNHRRDNGRR